ncbi:LTA synthase family protein [Paenibacillus sambharensis]|uniref:LTA synthase family protein n=1 Tax=Paenibacillus sambharensis TaxID=1803190 RepID=A0A2W1L9K6_9BACL|nr:LTA synthase family protein [Paenibacillus sambharensis]PZD95926.1 LTA synthase family protein [Paenibacillus sambharensis]
MLTMLISPARQGIRFLFRFMERAYALDVLLFFVLMLAKLYLFDRMVHVRNMMMTPTDALVAAATLALLCFWTVWLPFRARLAALTALNVLLTIVLYADLVYFRYFQDLISVPVLLQAGQLGALGESIGALLDVRDLLYAADWLILIPLTLYAVFKRDRSPEGRRIRPKRLTSGFRPLRYAAGILLLTAGITFIHVPVTKAKNTWAQGLFTGNWWNLSLYNVTGLYGFHGYDTYRFITQQWLGGRRLTDEEAAASAGWFEERGLQRKAAQQDKLFGAYKGRNVIMVQGEALQSFVINHTIEGREITPNLNRLLKESWYFNRFYHQVAQGRTSDADFAAQCSQHPLQSGSVFFRHADHTFDCLPQTLRNAGYGTSVYHAYDAGFWNRNTVYRNMGYDTFYSKKHYEIDEPLGWSLGDRSFFRQSAEWIAGQQQPFYSFLITLSSHHPYKLPAGYEKLDVGAYRNTLFGDYLQAIHYLDSALGQFIDSLKQRGLWDSSIFIFYGDHDNSIRDWSKFEKVIGRKLNEVDRYQTLKQVPLVIHLPDGAKAGTVSPEIGGQIDIAPSILHLLGIDSSSLAMAGRPLTTEEQASGRMVVFRSGAFTDGRIFYLPAGSSTVQGCFRADSGEPLPTEDCKEGRKAAADEITHSMNVVEGNLLKRIRRAD